MTFARYPHSATLSYTSAGTYSTLGVYTPGTVVTVALTCRIEMNGRGRKIMGASGDMEEYTFDLFCAPTVTVPADAKIIYGGRTYDILGTPPYQKHQVIQC